MLYECPYLNCISQLVKMDSYVETTHSFGSGDRLHLIDHYICIML